MSKLMVIGHPTEEAAISVEDGIRFHYDLPPAFFSFSSTRPP